MLRTPALVLVTAVVLGAGGVALVGSASSARADTVPSSPVLPTLYVNYDMNCTFRMTTDAGAPVAQISPGAYQVLVTTPTPFASVDLSGINNMMACGGAVSFQLTGPGVSIRTNLQDGDDVSELSSATFAPGSTYTALDVKRPSTRTTFTTSTGAGAVAVTPPPAASAATGAAPQPGAALLKPDPFRGTLEGVVSATGKLTIDLNGRAVSNLESGWYTVTVTDRSAASGLTVRGARKVTVTTTRFVGRRSVQVDLKPGQWLFSVSPRVQRSFFVVVG